MNQDSAFLTITSFPRLGTSTSQWPECQNNRSSLDQFVSPESRHQALVSNIRFRRARNVGIGVPIYQDVLTPWPFHDPTTKGSSCECYKAEAVLGKECRISMDSTVSACSCCGLQVTMQLNDVAEARKLHDQLIPLAPIMLALTAATTIWKGLLADTDVRWNALSASLDDRTLEEIGVGVRA